ncbi:coiled-coil domain-containing protein [Plantactinospora sp. GCM10030261]|uniref:coiled-coil domain-containing protein n=1 Tax=Plantactinospora sp. GCM10030261 TaxID=3273420 RepID=UPI00360865C1
MPRRHRWLAPIVGAVAAIAVLATPAPAAADPDAPAPDGHGETQKPPPLLSDWLESTNRAFVQAKGKLDKSKQRQQQLTTEMTRAQGEIDRLMPEVGTIAASSYRTGRLGGAAMLLNSASSDTFVDRAARLHEVNLVNDSKIGALNDARNRATQAKILIDVQIAEQQRQTNVMAKQKQEADKAFKLLGGNRSIRDVGVASTSPVAKAAPRDSDGGWPSESCNKNDPTTSGCVTGRTLNAYHETRKAGFTRFVGCHRSGGPFEHPKGRACDWSLVKSGFVSAQNTDQRRYGNNLAAFLVRNADRLGIYYIIWYKQIWFPTTGWSSYSGPSDHTDHVHMSML